MTAVFNLQCSGCGACVEAACDCGVGYVTAGARAAAAVAKAPEKSDRAIAAEIGVDHKTVGSARRSVGDHSPPEKRTGKDGKQYPVTQPAKKDPTRGSTPNGGFLLRANEALAFATFDGNVDKRSLNAARATSSAWCRLVETMEQYERDRKTCVALYLKLSEAERSDLHDPPWTVRSKVVLKILGLISKLTDDERKELKLRLEQEEQFQW